MRGASLSLVLLCGLSCTRCHHGGSPDDGWGDDEYWEADSYDSGRGPSTTARSSHEGRGDEPARLLQPADLSYEGAFRMPPTRRGASDAETWRYGLAALTHNPEGDRGGPADGFPGSLFGTGHNAHNYISEISIPRPAQHRDVRRLPAAKTLQPLRDVRGRLFRSLREIPRVGIAYVPGGSAGRLGWIYMTFGAHMQEEGSSEVVPPLARVTPDLFRVRTEGAWWLDEVPLYSTNGYMLTIPEQWARQHVRGRSLAVGRFRDGGWSGRGPSLHAIAPWQHGDPPRPGARLSSVTLLQYQSTTSTRHPERRLDGYHHSDEWMGGAWVSTRGRSALLFAGTKGSGYCWYGWASPRGDGRPCVEGGVRDSVTCYDPEGRPCSRRLARHCRRGASVSYRGWWSSRFDAQILFYDPADLERVAASELRPWEPQPYATLDIDEHLFLPNRTAEPMNTGRDEQRRFRLGEPAFDAHTGLLYVPEQFADGERPVVHVFAVR